MKNAKRLLSLLLIVVMIVPMCVTTSLTAFADKVSEEVEAPVVSAPADAETGDTEAALAGASTISPALNGETSRSTKTLYTGVTSTNIKTSSSSKYELQNFNIVEFDLAQTDLYVDVTNTRDYVNQSKTTLNTVTSFNSSNGQGKVAIAAVNGDLWTMSSAHSRVEGSGTSYNGYSDAVVTKALTLPRGYTVYNGEIVCSAQIRQETPYEGDFWSFGVTNDSVPMIGRPDLAISVKNNTKSVTVAADGLNRLPANNALVVYSDKGVATTNSLSDAYEVVIDFTSDYTVKHGATMTGTVTAIYSSATTSNPTMQANRMILTGRGTALNKMTSFAVGDSVTLSFNVSERYGRNTEGWQNCYTAVGGHMPFVVDGVKQETGTSTNYPTTIIGIKNNGSVAFVVNDGRQSSFSTGLDFNDYWDFADDMDFNTAFILDGGGSANLIELQSSGSYAVVNSPSDGSTRSVVNSVILSAGPKRAAQGKNEIVYPDPSLDLKNLYFATDDAFLTLGNYAESTRTKVMTGAKLTVKEFLNGPTVSVSYGLPNTTSYNSNSVLAGKSYMSVNATNYPYMVIDASIVSANSSVVQFQALYHTSGSRKGVSSTTFIGFNNAYNNNGFNKYVINPASNSAYSGRLNTLRYQYLYPANGVTVQDGDYIIIRSVRLATSATEAAG
ncbi:MAG: phosphodiester glycosidase family protein, partial [Clostridia bacterium]|nr:phosphodiester glycosidase family protein [Clostridia bacterium]